MRPLLALALVATLALPAAARADGPIRRFALVAGANDGGAGRERLRYAATDARAVARVFDELGGVAAEDRLLLLDPDRAAMQAGLARLRARIERARADGSRLEAFVYYSGHSDEEGLLLGGERFGYDELRHALELLPADVRVAILDSCASGALTRRKGGKRRAPFLVDASTQVKGHAFLTSSSEDEAAQESDRIGASFFTHYLVSGLRGAADSTRDGRVTLTEAYQFAFQETLARTQKTRGGAQHAAYEMQLVGTGDLVMTDLRSTSAGLTLDEELSGRIFVRDASGALVVELRKLPASPVSLGLAPGDYVVTVDDGRGLSEARLTLAEGRPTTLSSARLVAVEGEHAVARGDAPRDDSAYRYEPFRMSFVPMGGDDVITGFGLHWIGGRSARLQGAELSLGVNIQTESADGLQATVGANLVDGPVDGFQVAVGFNHANGPLDGAQVAAGFNHAAGDAGVAQVAAGANLARGRLDGLQMAAGLNWAQGRVKGAQLSAGANVTRERLTGLQIASGANWAEGDANGLQLASGVNVAGGDLLGAQIAAGLNVAARGGRGLQAGTVNWSQRDFEGAQIAVVNVGGGDVNGTQIGVVNVATGRADVQIGAFNYADDSDVTVGVVSVVPKGMFRLAAWADETNPGNLALKLGGRYVYGLVSAGVAGKRTAEERIRWMTGVGIGGHVPVDRPFLSFVDVELIGRQIFYGAPVDSDEPEQLQTLRVAGGWQLAPALAIIAGPSLNVHTTQEGRGGFGFLGESAVLHEDGDNVVRLYPGLFLGLQI